MQLKIPEQRQKQLREQYETALLQDVLPWWMEHSLDRELGGYYSHLDREGKPYSTDKYMWMNGRQIWMLSHLYNTHEPREEWLAAARLGVDFLLRHAFKPDGKMHFRLTREGKSRSEVLSLYTEVFAAMALAEYSRAARDEAAGDRALAMYESLAKRLGRPSDTPMLGYPLHARFHLHAHDMCRITVARVFRELRADRRFDDDIALSIDSILRKHWKPETGVLLENVAADGSEVLDIVEGRLFHPGHAIESAWMFMEVAVRRGDDALFATAAELALAAMRAGWDEEFGGIRYLVNIDATPVHNIEADCKLWWPHTEALYALLLAWGRTGRAELRDAYEKVHEYTFRRFPDPEGGEWFGYLNRDGSPIWTAKANGWKGCFHLPRALYRCYGLLSEA